MQTRRLDLTKTSSRKNEYSVVRHQRLDYEYCWFCRDLWPGELRIIILTQVVRKCVIFCTNLRNLSWSGTGLAII